MRQRLRRPLPFLKGLDKAKKIAFDWTPDDETYENLAEQIVEDFAFSCGEIEYDWYGKGQGYKADCDWMIAKQLEEGKLKREMKSRAIRSSKVLERVNGGYIDVNAQVFNLPLTQADLEC